LALGNSEQPVKLELFFFYTSTFLLAHALMMQNYFEKESNQKWFLSPKAWFRLQSWGWKLHILHVETPPAKLPFFIYEKQTDLRKLLYVDNYPSYGYIILI
jgi:hypothetical protein